MEKVRKQEVTKTMVSGKGEGEKEGGRVLDRERV